jgi:hypothetical protein
LLRGKGADDLPHLALVHQLGDADAAGAGIVQHDGEVAGALLDQPLDQHIRLADAAEAADEHGGAILHAGQRLGDRLHDLVDHPCPSRGCRMR